MKNIVVAPQIMHKQLLSIYRKEDCFKNIKIVDRTFIIDSFFGKIAKEAKAKVMNEFNLNYETATELLSYCRFIKTSKNPKTNQINKINNYLEKNKLLEKNEYLVQALKSANIEVYGYSKDDIQLNHVFETLDVEAKYKINETKLDGKKLRIFSYVDDEVLNVLNKITSLINSGVSQDNIYIYGIDDSYSYYFDKYSKDFNIKVNNLPAKPLLFNGILSNFINFYKDTKDVNLAKEMLITLVNDDDEVTPFLDIINDSYYDFLPFEMQLDYFESSFKNIKEGTKKYKPAINALNDYPYLENAHIFIVGFAQGKIPLIAKDDLYLSDQEIEGSLVPNSKLKNKISKTLLLSFLSSDNKFYFTCSRKSTSNKYYPSSIAKEFSFKEYKAALPFEYCSEKYANIEHAQLLDLFYLFKDTSADYFAFSKSRKLDYRIYDNSVTDLNIFNENTFLNFSYSSLDKYYSCPFKYYSEYVLGLGEFESNFNTKFGTFAHDILEKQYNACFDFEKEWDYQLTKFEFSKKELILLDGLKKQVKLAVETCLKHANEFSVTPRNFSESKIIRNIDDRTILEGRIDRITIVKEKYYYVLDYKTGKETFSPKFLNYGQSTQLPTYIILTEEHPELSNMTLAGIYINNIIDTSVKKETLDDDKLVPSYLMLNGKTLANQEVINYLDTTFEASGPTKSSFIKGLAITKKGGFDSKSTAYVSESEFISYRNIVFDLIVAAARDIRSNMFDIAPKFFSSKDHACQYCEFKDICFKKYQQINFIPSSDLDIDGGTADE